MDTSPKEPPASAGVRERAQRRAAGLMASDNQHATWLRKAVAGRKPGLSDELYAEFRQLDAAHEIAELAVYHKVAPWLLAALRSAAPHGELEQPSLAAVRVAGVAQAARTMTIANELPLVLARMNELSIDVIVLKGPQLAARYYPDPRLRVFNDLDLMVDEGELGRAGEVLVSLGYENHEGFEEERLHPLHGLWQRQFVRADGAVTVDLHCDHLQLGLEPAGMAGIRERSTVASFGPSQARVLEPHDLFLHLCVHLHMHGFEGLAWFKDLDLMLRREQLDWELISRSAEAQGCGGSIGFTLELLEQMLGTPIPPGAQRLLAGRSRWSRALHRLVWRPERILALEPQRPMRFRRAMQFAPESGFFRGGLPSLLFWGRRLDKLRVLGSRVPRPRRRAPAIADHDRRGTAR